MDTDSALPGRVLATTAPTRANRHTRWWVGSLGLLTMAGLGIWQSTKAKSHAPMETAELHPVAVVQVHRETLAREVTVPAEFRPYLEVDLHSKVAGFLDSIAVDIGDSVAAGQILATLEIPELRDDLRRARALEQRSVEEVRRLESALEETHLAATRLAAVNQAQPNLIAQQELDTARAKDRQAASALAGAVQQVEVNRAETSKLNTLAQYSRITAPFAGVITKRSADPGALIPAVIASGSAAPLLRLSQLDRLRLVFPVSMSYVSQVHVGTPVEIHVQNREPSFAGKIARISQKIETSTRTMEAEVDVSNADASLIPGMYASVIIQLERHEKTLSLPIQAVARDRVPNVYLINSNQTIEVRPVKLGLETPTRIEILAGLTEQDRVMTGGRGQVQPGQKVQPKLLVPDQD